MIWPTMQAYHQQVEKDIAAPLTFEPAGFGMLRRIRPKIERRFEYGMGHAWFTLRVFKWKLWLRVEKDA